MPEEGAAGKEAGTKRAEAKSSPKREMVSGLELSPIIIGYLLGLAILLIGLAGLYLDPCDDIPCCQSFFGQAIGSEKCAETTYYGERPWSVELCVLGVFFLMATRLLTKG